MQDVESLTPGPMTPPEKQILVLSSITHFLTHLFETMLLSITTYMVIDPRFPWPALLQGTPVTSLDAEALDSNRYSAIADSGLLLYLLFGILAPVWGYLTDRFAAKWTLGIGFVLAGAGYCWASTAGSLTLLWVAFGLVGLGIASYHPAGLALISRNIRERGRAMGINGIWGNAGIASGPFLAGFGGLYLGWRTVFLTIGVIGITAGFSMFLLKTESKQDETPISKTTTSRKARMAYFLLMALVLLVSGLMYRANIVALPKHFEQHIGSWLDWFQNILPGAELQKDPNIFGARMLMTLVVLVGASGHLIGGWLADRMELRKGYAMFSLICIPGLAGMAYFSDSALVLAALMYFTFSLGLQSIENSLIAYLTPAQWRSTFYSLKFIILFGIGSLGVSMFTAVEREWHDTHVLYWILCGMQVVVFLLMAGMCLIGRDQQMRQGIMKNA